MAAALPALEEARIALSDLEKSDVTEIRSVLCNQMWSIVLHSANTIELHMYVCILEFKIQCKTSLIDNSFYN